jgi:hypothetical protein
MSPLVSQIANFATPPVVAVLTAIITVQLSFRRFQAERWWDRKADAYSRIIEALHHAIAHASMVSVRLTASTKTDRDLRENWDGRKSGRQETAGAAYR